MWIPFSLQQECERFIYNGPEWAGVLANSWSAGVEGVASLNVSIFSVEWCKLYIFISVAESAQHVNCNIHQNKHKQYSVLTCLNLFLQFYVRK